MRSVYSVWPIMWPIWLLPVADMVVADGVYPIQTITRVLDIFFPYPPLDNIQVMVIVWRLKGNTIRTGPCWVVWHNVHSQQHTHMSSSYRSSRLGLSHWDPYAMH